MNDVATTTLQLPTIEWDKPLQGIWAGEPILTPEGKPLTLRYAVVEALAGAYPNEMSVSGEERTLRWELAEKIIAWKPGGDMLKLKSEQLGTIKGCVLKRWPQSFLYTQIVRLLDPGERP